MICDIKHTLCSINQPIIVCEEIGKKYVAKNPARSCVYQFQIDGGVITGCKVKRCDYLVENESNTSAYFVELKGTDIPTGCDQIHQTIKMFDKKLLGYSVHARIICSRVSTLYINDSHYRTLKKRCPDLKVQTKQYEEYIS